MRIPAQPGSAATFSQPEMPRSISATTRSRTSWSPSAATHSSTPRPSRLGGRIVASVVAAAVYGYWSAATSRPSARAASSTAMASPARPHTARAPHLRCETWSRAPAAPASRAARTVAIDSASDANRPAPSLRMCVAYRPPRRAAAVTSCDELVGVGVDPGRVDQPGRQPERAGVQRGLDLAHHRRALRLGCRSRLGAHHGPANRPVPDEERDIQPERLGRDGVQVLAERPPARDQLVRSQRQLDELPPGIGDRRERVPAVAGQLGREPLAQVADERAIDEQRAVRVPVRVDESGRDDEPAGVDHLRDVARVDRREVVDREDPVAQDPDVRAATGRSGAIHDGAAAQEQVEGGHPLMMPARTGTSPDGVRRASILRRGCPRSRDIGDLEWNHDRRGPSPTST